MNMNIAPNFDNVDLGKYVTDPRARKVLYTLGGLLSVAAALTIAGFVAAQVVPPMPLAVAFAVIFLFSSMTNKLAQANTPAGKHAAAEPEHEVILEDE